MPKLSEQIKLLLEMYDQAYDHTAWHGTNLRGSLKGKGVHVRRRGNELRSTDIAKAVGGEGSR